ncbi:hypothetical protein Acr_26g0014290 [Actinidia rufa]|uniref:Uncharacterized protein n=1 Tax=Actinidia rufa TaxID=165716 RepID=A0A7J0H4X9_9ERIC|nr:hypothetical protein Acr_26g0014290 [Actinidia rufa]
MSSETRRGGDAADQGRSSAVGVVSRKEISPCHIGPPPRLDVGLPVPPRIERANKAKNEVADVGGVGGGRRGKDSLGVWSEYVL